MWLPWEALRQIQQGVKEVNLSKFVIELFELSGMSEADFCQKLNIDNQAFIDIKSDSDENNPSVKTLLRAISASLFSKAPIDTAKFENADFVHNKLTQAHAIIVTVGESEHLEEHHQTSLSVASELVDHARQKI